MSDFYLKFKDEAESIHILFTEVDGELVKNYANTDVIGLIYPYVDPTQQEQADPVPFDGWFVNVRTVEYEDPTPLEPFNIDPQPYPLRIWA